MLVSLAIALLFATTHVVTAATREECCHVVKLTATATGDDAWTFAATLSSPYEATTGWEKYCNAFEIRDADSDEGTVLATRVLGHPHPEEQPFTRSTTAAIPPGVRAVIAIARDSAEGYCGDAVYMEMDAPSPISSTNVRASVPASSSSSGEATKAPVSAPSATASPPTAAATAVNAASTGWAFTAVTLFVATYRLG